MSDQGWKDFENFDPGCSEGIHPTGQTNHFATRDAFPVLGLGMVGALADVPCPKGFVL